MNQLIQSGMVVILEKGLESSVAFMQAIKKRGIEHDLKGWWWSSDKGLIKDPSDSDEMVVKAQLMYDAMIGRPVDVGGVKMFQTHSRSEMDKMINVCQHDLLALEATNSKTSQDTSAFDNKHQHPTTTEGVSGSTKLPPRDTPPLPLRTSSDNYDPRLDSNLGK